MQKFTHTLAIVLLCGTLCTATVDARGRQNDEKRGRPEKTERQDVKKQQHQAAKSQRPGGHQAQPQRPGGHQAQPQHPGGHQAQPQRPGGHQAQPQHPGGHQTPPPPPQANKHGNKYQNNSLHHRPVHNKVGFGRPHNPKMHPPRPYYRPTPPPPAWRPTVWRPINTILGVTLGSVLHASIDMLLNSGYNVTGYDDTTVYLNNVRMLNMSWPDVSLYYGDGGLYGSEFVYSTPNNTLSRYNKVYNNLVYVYGQPYLVQNLNGGGRLATWWGNDGQYITLSFGGGMSNAGGLRYYTTLSFGR